MGLAWELASKLIRELTTAKLAAREERRGQQRKSVLTSSKRGMAVKLLALGDRSQDMAEAIGVSASNFYRYFPASRTSAAKANGLTS